MSEVGEIDGGAVSRGDRLRAENVDLFDQLHKAMIPKGYH